MKLKDSGATRTIMSGNPPQNLKIIRKLKHFLSLYVSVSTGEVDVMKNTTGLFMKLFVLASVFLLFAGCSSQKEDKDAETIQTFLEKEFTGPGEELTSVLEKGPSKLEEYAEENYKPLVMNVGDMVNANHILVFQQFAYKKGYQLKPEAIDIEKVEDQAYQYEVEVEYEKDGQKNTAAVTARVNLNDEGEIVTIRNMDDGGLLEMLRQ
jgi:hypothetical protein